MSRFFYMNVCNVNNHKSATCQRVKTPKLIKMYTHLKIDLGKLSLWK